MMELMEKDGASIMDAVVKQMNAYSTPINGVRALIVIPVMAFLFHKDRTKEKARGFHPNKKAPIWKYFAVIVIAAAMCLGLNNLITIGNFSAAARLIQRRWKECIPRRLLYRSRYWQSLCPSARNWYFAGCFSSVLGKVGDSCSSAAVGIRIRMDS